MLVLAGRYAPTNELAASHLIHASSFWQAAGRPDRARLCLQRIAPDDLSTAIIGQVTFRSARSAFSSHASPRSLADMAGGAEVCGATEPAAASIMWADAAASAVLIDDFDLARSDAQRAVDMAEGRPGVRGWALFARDAVSTIVSGPGTLEKSAMQDLMVGLTSSGTGFPGSPQLAYILSSALVHVATPALMGRWLTWMDEAAHSSQDPCLAAAVALACSRARLYAGDVPQALSRADFAVTQFSTVHDIALLARSLGWSAWVHAGVGQTRRRERRRTGSSHSSRRHSTSPTSRCCVPSLTASSKMVRRCTVRTPGSAPWRTNATTGPGTEASSIGLRQRSWCILLG